ncbi:MAG: transketolase [Oscillospiraceae bacterium]|jgi:transketolase|nr:transketolase [Oscillospiraceae bacterium]
MNNNLPLRAAELRLSTLHVFEARGFGHVGGAMSVVETLAVLYNGVMNVRPEQPDWAERDRLVCSKGHAGPAVYAALAGRGFFGKELLQTLNRPGTSLPSHCDMNKTPGVDMTTGSLGQGVSTAVGLALAQKMRGYDARTYLIVGDGECDEGQVWEGLMLAAHKKLDNLTVFCDKNGQQLDGYVKNVLDTGDLAQKFASFGFFTQSVDGHDTGAIAEAIEAAKAHTGEPAMIVLNTKKGYGCTFAEDQEFNHHIAFTPEQMQEALAAAQKRLEEVSA